MKPSQSIQSDQPILTLNSHGDSIAQLPVDQTTPNYDELQIIDTLFKKNRKTMDIVFEEAKDAMIVALLVILFCLPKVDDMIKNFLPITVNSPYILALVKGLGVASLFWLVKYFYLSRK